MLDRRALAIRRLARLLAIEVKTLLSWLAYCKLKSMLGLVASSAAWRRR